MDKELGKDEDGEAAQKPIVKDPECPPERFRL